MVYKEKQSITLQLPRSRMPHFSQADILFEASRNGVHYVELKLDGQIWRLGSLNQDWRQIIAELRSNERCQELTGQEIWLQRGLPDSQPGILCCGLGSVWPGMGRELYNQFPAARMAMNEIASLADWDILGLMECGQLGKISQTRWQIPYLFMLEYAQWRQFHSLGLNPGLVCGHSLGELIALCLAGVYDLRAAWYLLETRAEHMADLEAKNGKQGGMLAVPAQYGEIERILSTWPDLRIANRNTPSQYILAGPRDQLLEARKSLRRKRIPAVMLNMDLAFHNPAMKILRDVSYRRLNTLDMRPASFPMLSCVDAKEYPTQRTEICRRITDLDENPVDWVLLIETVTQNYPVSAFIELGPQETLCGISAELAPGCVFIPADKKGHEAKTMAQACARLYAAGFLDNSAIAATCEAKKVEAALAPPPAPAVIPVPDKEQTIIFELLAEICGKNPKDILPEQELRQDLGLRSANFPFLMLEAETRLGHPVIFENLFQLVTVADLLQFLTNAQKDRSAQQPAAARAGFIRLRQPLQRLGLNLAPVCLDPAMRKSKGKAALLGLNALGIAPEAVALPGWEKATFTDLPTELAPGLTIVYCQQESSPDNEEKIIQRLLRFQPGRLLILRRFPAQYERVKLQSWLENAKESGVHRIAWLGDSWLDSQNPEEPGRMLAREILYGKDAAIIWQQAGSPVYGNYCVNSEVFRAVFPDPNPQYPADASLFQGQCQYSLYADAELVTHGANAGFTPLSQQPDCHFPKAAWLPLSAALASLKQTTAILEPELELVGFADLRVKRALALPMGITRECRIVGSNRLSLLQEGALAHICRINMAAAGLTANGRHSGVWLPFLSGDCVLAAQNPSFPALIEQLPEWLQNDNASLNALYEQLNFGQNWRFLQTFALLEQNTALASVSFENGSDIQQGIFKLLDACLQACMAFLAQAEGLGLASWRFAAIGYVRFDCAAASRGSGDMDLYLRKSWHDARLIRFDAQISGKACGLILTVHNLEFDYADQ